MRTSPTTSTSSLTLAPPANHEATATRVNSKHVVAAPPPPPSALPQALHRLQLPASSPRLHAPPPADGTTSDV
nr:unnamed protein product [Spirometra erinaceieuropaei]